MKSRRRSRTHPSTDWNKHSSTSGYSHTAGRHWTSSAAAGDNQIGKTNGRPGERCRRTKRSAGSLLGEPAEDPRARCPRSRFGRLLTVRLLPERFAIAFGFVLKHHRITRSDESDKTK